jgi:hypothetical protein
MVSEYGMSDVVGPRRLAGATNAGGGDGPRRYSEEKARLVDAEIDALVEAGRREARRLLVEHRDTLDRLAEALVEQETLDETDLAMLFGELVPAGHVESFDGPAAPIEPMTRSVERPGGAEVRAEERFSAADRADGADG